MSVSSEISAEANAIIMDLLPDKSSERYLQEYHKFMNWKKEEHIDEAIFSEEVMLAYFGRLHKKYSCNSLWTFYSMLKTTIQQHHNVDIKYAKLIAFLKKISSGFIAKKSNVFEADEIRKFLKEADDFHYLLAKVTLIFGVYGATRADELCKVSLDDVKRHGQVIIVKIPETKTKIIRSFTLENEFVDYVLRYIEKRPSKAPFNRFFLNYQKGKCTVQPVGRNKFLTMPKVIATYLDLPDVESYTGHSFRRTSATLLADAGADILTLKRHGGWKSNSVVEGYVDNSINNKRKIECLITEQINSVSSTVTSSQSACASEEASSNNGNTLTSTITTLESTVVNVTAAEGAVLNETNDANHRRVSSKDFFSGNSFKDCNFNITYQS